eukprot:750232-Amorphochlora_amoeboformis.AAC.1
MTGGEVFQQSPKNKAYPQNEEGDPFAAEGKPTNTISKPTLNIPLELSANAGPQADTFGQRGED